MFTVVITEKGGTQQRLTFGEPEVTIGRVPGNDVVLPKGNVSKRHSRIVLKDNRFIVVDLKSTNGTYVNGRKITSPLVVKEGDKIYIGDFVLTLEGDPSLSGAGSMRPPSLLAPADPDTGERLAGSGMPPLPSRAPEPLPDDGIPAVLRGGSEPPSLPPTLAASSAPPPHNAPRTLQSLPPVIANAAASERPPAEQTNVAPHPEPANGSSDPAGLSLLSASSASNGRAEAFASALADKRNELRLLMARVARDFDVESVDPAARADERRWQKAERVVQAKLTELASEGYLVRSDRMKLAKVAVHEAVGLGPFESLLADPEVCHIVVEQFDRIRVDRGQGLMPESASFSSPHAVHTVVRRLGAEAGLTGTLPECLDLSLPSGLHLVALLRGAATEGPMLSLRRRPPRGATLRERHEQGALSEAHYRAIHEALRAGQPLWLVGPSGAELAGMLAAALADCPEGERVALFERSPEIALGERAALCVRLGNVPLETLLERVRYFRPDRLVFHEPAEHELELVLHTLARRHEGSLVSLEQKSAKDALSLLERIGGAALVLRAAGLLVEVARSSEGPQVRGAYRAELDATGALALTAV